MCENINKLKMLPNSSHEAFVDQLVKLSNGLNINDLYNDLLFVLHHHRKFCREANPEVNDLVAHLQNVFRIENEKHDKFIANVENREALPLVLNLEVVEAKGLKAKDVNGLSDPACTIFISPRHKEYTTIQFETLSPVWQEYFSIPISNVKEDVFHLEVWDYDREDTVTERIKRLKEVKSGKRLKIFVKDLTQMSGGKQKQDFLGRLKLPLINVPTVGLDGWYTLESRNEKSSKKKGEIQLRMGLGVKKERPVVMQEYQHVLHMMLAYELVCEQNIEPYKWDGVFTSKLSKTILKTLELQGGLTKKNIDVAQWLVYTKVHCEQHPLDTNVFPTLLQSISDHLKSKSFGDTNELSKFWLATDKLMKNFVEFFQNAFHHQQELLSSNNSSSCVHSMLKTIQLVSSYLTANPNTSKEFDLSLVVSTIDDKMKSGISLGANKFFEENAPLNLKLEGSCVDHLVKVGKLLIANLEKSLVVYQNDFQSFLGIDYFDITYLVYDQKYLEIVAPIVAQTCTSFGTLNLINEENYECCQEEDVSVGTSLFKLYLVLKHFAELSTKMQCNSNALCIQGTFHKWFHNRIVVQWLDIARLKAMSCIRVAVLQDNLHPLDDFAKITSSAVDTAGILQRIEIWNQLSWPEVEGSSSFTAKILDDLGECAIFYADLMCDKVEQLENFVDKQYYISDELCFAINNIERVAAEMKLISGKVGVNNLLEKLEKRSRSTLLAQLKVTLISVMENAAENINNKDLRILEEAGRKMRPEIQNMVIEASDSKSEYCVDKIENYLGKDLNKLNKKLAQPTFKNLFAIIWESVLMSLKSVTVTSIEKQPDCFQLLQKLLSFFVSFFYPEGSKDFDIISSSDEVQEIQRLLEIHGASSSQLILNYFQERCKLQSQMISKATTSDLGFLAVRAQYCEDVKMLKIELLNARNLKPRESKALPDPYVKITMVTNEFTSSDSSWISKTKRKTLFPWFDETFSIPFTKRPDEQSAQGIIVFTIKDYGLLGTSSYIGDCFLNIDTIAVTTFDAEFKDISQEILPLTLPSKEEHSSLNFKTLESRQCDKDAVEFVKRENYKAKASTVQDAKQAN